MVGLFLFLLGLAIGSFINCLVYRLNLTIPTPRRWAKRSFCPRCKKQILWHDNIPLLSFVLLKGKCRFCHSSISWQYPIVELVTGIFFVGIWWWVKNWCGESLSCFIVSLFHCFIVASLVAIFVSDLRYQTIPDEIVYPAIGVTILFLPQAQHLPVRQAGHLGGVFLAGLGAAGFFLLLFLITRGKGMGLGDVKLAGLMGLVLGFPKIIIALFLAFLTGAFIGVILILSGKKRFGQHVPFGPFLILGTFIAWFWGEAIWQWYWQ